MNELYHHGILGQRWGVRRFQNSDGSYTPEGLKRLMYARRVRRAAATSKQVDSIINTMSDDERKKLGIGKGERYLDFEQGSQVAKRILLKSGRTPVSFFDLLEEGNEVNVSLGTRSGNKYRGKGYASKVARQGLDWYDKNKDKYGYTRIVWGVRTDNIPSIRIAKKYGFNIDPNSYSDDNTWVNYIKT